MLFLFFKALFFEILFFKTSALFLVGYQLSKQHQAQVLQQTLSPNTQSRHEVLAEKSIIQQHDLEMAETENFYQYVQQFR